ncbi:hypothetical protein D3C78_1626070 [compost metagenome]
MARRQESAALTKPKPAKPAAINGIIRFVTPPPRFPQPPVTALAVPTTFGANIIEVWNCVITNEAPIMPITKRNNKKLS